MDTELGNLAMWSLIVGFVSPLVIAMVQQSSWSNSVRAIVTFLFAAIVAVPTAYFAGDLEGRDYVASALLILVTAISTYGHLWKPTNVAPSIEAATSGHRAPPAAA